MNKWVVSQLVEEFKDSYGTKLDSAEGLWETEMHALEMLMRLGRQMIGELMAEVGSGYQGTTVEKEGEQYRFEGNREKVVHGLFGTISYQRAYYRSTTCRDGWFPLDERLSIGKKHTPACQYFLSSFTIREGYQESLQHFHEIFRPDGVDLISMRKALDMDYELGERFEHRRQQEIEDSEHGAAVATDQEIAGGGTMVVSIDAGKVRTKGRSYVDDDGNNKYETVWRDAKLAVISQLGWNDHDRQPFCERHSYVGGIEHADQLFRRIWVEMNRRCSDLSEVDLVFIGDGAQWIWDRVGDLADSGSVFILDFYHATEHVAELCKLLFVEGSEHSRQQYRAWRQMLWDGAVDALISELRHLRDGPLRGTKGDRIQREINYFKHNRRRMDYPRYRDMKLPIGSGTVESGCKHVVAKRLKQAGMTWTVGAARGMLDLRTSLKSGRFRRDFLTVLPSRHDTTAGPMAA